MLKTLFTLLLINGSIMAQDLNFANRLYHEYENYKEQSLTKRRFKHADIVPLIEQLKNKNIFTVKKAGESVEGRAINLISIGTGKTKIFLWSQMHGDEPTATMALFDIFNFFSDSSFNDFKKELLRKVTIYFMPMVNPDGAEVYERRNIFNIDLNRDAVKQATPEAQVLKNTFDSLKADFGFNLHDQSTRYSAGNSFKSAVLSFLAPTIDYEKSLNPVREKAIKLISELYKTLSDFIPGHIAKYTDEFEPRAFGDNFQKWGTSTILIESGGWKNDPEKQFIRKLNFIAMLSAFKSIAERTYEEESVETYDSIPFNEKYIMDVVLRNLKIKNYGREYLIDIGINLDEVNLPADKQGSKGKEFYYKSSVEDLGDLSVFFGYEDYDLKGMEVIPGKTLKKKFDSIKQIEKLNLNDLYKDGYTNVVLNSNKIDREYTSLPVNISLNSYLSGKDDEIKLEKPANFIIKKDGEIVYVVVNGFVYNIKNQTGEIKNGLIYH